MIERDTTSYRPIRIIGVLLLLEVAGLVGLGAYEFSRVEWRQINIESLSQPTTQAFGILLFVPSAILAGVSALSFLLLRRRGWLLAAISQGAILAVCLWLYTTLQPIYVYPVMVYGIVLALYLNSRTVRIMFHLEREDTEKESEEAA